MHIAFFGSPKLASDILTHIHERYPVSLVITQPDKPVGRKQVLTPTPVKTFAEQHNIPILTNISKNRYFDMFKDKQIDIAIVVAYGELIPKQLLETPRFGFLNVHYSLLPAYRGAAPVQWAILNGDEKTGVTIMQLDEVLDHGPLVAIKETIIDPNDTTETLLQRLTDTAKLLIFDILNQIEKNGKLPSLTTQNHDLATSTRQLTKDDGFIPFERLQKALRGEKLTFGDLPKFQKEVFEKKLHVTGYTLHDVHNFIRALNPWPIAWTLLQNGKRVKIFKSHLENRNGDIHYVLVIDEIQMEGKSRTFDKKVINAIINSWR